MSVEIVADYFGNSRYYCGICRVAFRGAGDEYCDGVFRTVGEANPSGIVLRGDSSVAVTESCTSLVQYDASGWQRLFQLVGSCLAIYERVPYGAEIFS